MTNTDAELIADPDVQRLWDAAPLMPKLKGIIRDTRLTLNGIGFALTTAQEEAIMDATAQAIVNMVQKHLSAEGATGVPEGWRDIECMRLINALRADEGDEVTILCDNPDFNGQPNCVVECCGGWTRFGDQRFGGQTLLDALSAAWIGRQRASPNPPVRPEQSASERGRSSTTSTEGPAPVEAPHSVERDVNAVREALTHENAAFLPAALIDQALAALGRLADGARR